MISGEALVKSIAEYFKENHYVQNSCRYCRHYRNTWEDERCDDCFHHEKWEAKYDSRRTDSDGQLD